ncbi:MAG: outer membrane protein assembly factor BamA [Myxococcota bacterium]|nr:outer membrane protein assembly factor BamA [Myxococcota bacterium]
MRSGRAWTAVLVSVWAIFISLAPAVLAQEPSEDGPPDTEKVVDRIAVVPFRIHSALPLGYLTESLSDLLAARLNASDELESVPREDVEAALIGSPGADLADTQLRSLGKRLGVVAVVSGSLTELAGRFSLDARVTPVSGARSHTIVMTTANEEELLGRLGELAGRVTVTLSGVAPSVLAAVEVIGAGDLEVELLSETGVLAGDFYDPEKAQAARARLEAQPEVASVSLGTELTAEGVVLRFNVVRAELIFGGVGAEEGTTVVADVRVRGNRRIEADAILARIQTQTGAKLRPGQIASDVQRVFGLGFFANVQVFSDDSPDGVIVTFEVTENPVIRQISISGNDDIEVDKIRDALTLTTGSTLDYPLLHENTARIEALYRAGGYYLAAVTFEIEPLREGSIAINFDVDENEKLHLEEIIFEGNEAFSSSELTENFETSTWIPVWSTLTSWMTKSGTYSEPIFIRDIQGIEKKYTNSGYLQAEVGEPEVEPREDGLYLRVQIREGPQFRVGDLTVTGDATIDLEALREKLKLEEGDIFNRSYLTFDVEQLERFYTDRGFYFAHVTPSAMPSQESLTVDVEFQVTKGPLYFIRHIEIAGNTRTVDPVIRREMRMVEGQLYSARALQISNTRVRRLGFFEDVGFEPKPTDDPAQLDLEVNVVERPTGAFSFGAGFSSQDKFVLSASLNNSNAFGLGYRVNLTAEYGRRTSRLYLSATDPYFLDSEFSLGLTAFVTTVRFQDFEQDQQGVDLTLGHSLREDNTARLFLNYSFAERRIKQAANVNTSAPLFREILQKNESTSLMGIAFRSDTRDDRFAPTSGTNYGATAEYAGIGGFANFLRVDGRFSYYLEAPSWPFDRSAFVFSTRLGYTLPFNSVADYSLDLPEVTACDIESRCTNVARLDNIDTDVKLPLTDRYFLGGIGSYQLRGYKSRSLGPRRPLLRRNQLLGDGPLFFPVGTQLASDGSGGLIAVCNDVPAQQNNGVNNQGNLNGRCNELGDKDISDFDDLDETDVIGGNSFITSSLEYRFPLSQEAGLMGILFLDMGNGFYEGENLFDVTNWRYGYGGGVLWFSPFGPLQVVLGFPIDPLEDEKSPVFEFSVGGFGQ